MSPESRDSRGDHAAGAAGDGAGGQAISRARIDRLRASMPGRESVVEELIAAFLADLPRRLGAIAQAIGRGDGRALALNAHALRGGAANFGAARLDDLCGGLEEAGARGALESAPALLEEIERESGRVREALAARHAHHAADCVDGAGAHGGAAQKSSGNSR